MSLNRRSKHITEGVARASNRSMYYAMGYEQGDFSKPMVGVAYGHSTITPCNSGLQRLADAAVEGLKDAGYEFPRGAQKCRPTWSPACRLGAAWCGTMSTWSPSSGSHFV
jgi:dihydroxyacid dehydratase/phosphogluconate dehydratase